MIIMGYPKSKQLIEIFVSGLTEQFSNILKSEVLRFVFNNQKYMVYFKCVCYAGCPYPKNTTRAQLPQRKEFDSLKDDERFLFLGYDVERDLFVCWDPIKARSRLNKKKYVSFFCRQNIQESVKEGEILEATLTNGDVYVLFKRADVIRFFEMIEVHFPMLDKSSLLENKYSDGDVSDCDVQGYLYDVGDDVMVQSLVNEMIKDGQSRLKIVMVCSNTFGQTYCSMFFKEWDDVVKKYMASL